MTRTRPLLPLTHMDCATPAPCGRVGSNGSCSGVGENGNRRGMEDGDSGRQPRRRMTRTRQLLPLSHTDCARQAPCGRAGSSGSSSVVEEDGSQRRMEDGDSGRKSQRSMTRTRQLLPLSHVDCATPAPCGRAGSSESSSVVEEDGSRRRMEEGDSGWYIGGGLEVPITRRRLAGSSEAEDVVGGERELARVWEKI